MNTVIKIASRSSAIGSGLRFAVIGEHIRPSGRKRLVAGVRRPA